MPLYSYKLTNDAGFAPNPFGGVLTLATCKPGMRQSRRVGDWIAGFTSSKLNGDAVGAERLIYLMQVERKIPIADYFRNPRYRMKIPDLDAARAIERAGDNIYRPTRDHAVEPKHFEQLPNPHHWDGAKGCGGSKVNRDKDIGGKNVLIASKFVYFGRDALELPDSLRPEIPTGMSRYGQQTHDEARAQAIIEFALAQANGKQLIGAPYNWPEDDDSWQETLE